VPTGFGYTLPDQNGWSRYLHFQAAWLFLFAGAAYLLLGAVRGHFRRQLVPPVSERSWSALRQSIAEHLRPGAGAAPGHYNALQRISYLLVIFGLLPFMVWTGLAMSPAFASVVPGSVALLGGRQSARTLHFFATIALTLFVVVHVAMVARAGWKVQLRAMLTGTAEEGS
jgi:thiosulfate reductase cytochrome b subunit